MNPEINEARALAHYFQFFLRYYQRSGIANSASWRQELNECREFLARYETIHALVLGDRMYLSPAIIRQQIDAIHGFSMVG